MANSLRELLAQQSALSAKIDEMRSAAKSEAISEVRQLIEEHSLTLHDVFPSKSGAKTRKTSGNKVAAKYKDPISGASWTGRGMTPKWLAGKNKADYAIA